MSRFHPAVIIPGSIRIQRTVDVRTYITVRGVNGCHKFEKLVSVVHEEGTLAGMSYTPPNRAKCKNCNHMCHLDEAVAEALNVVPLRRVR
ncbi:MAG: hypothetical protein ACLQFR_15235 [Streptosporangiaceae bacterium]